MSKNDTVELKLTFPESWLVVKGLSAYMLFGNPTKKENQLIAELFKTLYEQWGSKLTET